MMTVGWRRCSIPAKFVRSFRPARSPGRIYRRTDRASSARAAVLALPRLPVPSASKPVDPLRSRAARRARRQGHRLLQPVRVHGGRYQADALAKLDRCPRSPRSKIAKATHARRRASRPRAGGRPARAFPPVHRVAREWARDRDRPRAGLRRGPRARRMRMAVGRGIEQPRRDRRRDPDRRDRDDPTTTSALTSLVARRLLILVAGRAAVRRRCGRRGVLPRLPRWSAAVAARKRRSAGRRRPHPPTPTLVEAAPARTAAHGIASRRDRACTRGAVHPGLRFECATRTTRRGRGAVAHWRIRKRSSCSPPRSTNETSDIPR